MLDEYVCHTTNLSRRELDLINLIRAKYKLPYHLQDIGAERSFHTRHEGCRLNQASCDFPKNRSIK